MTIVGIVAHETAGTRVVPHDGSNHAFLVTIFTAAFARYVRSAQENGRS